MDGADLSSLSFDDLLSREWLATNGVGGYASCTVPSVHTRKYHGLLVAPMSPPVRQMVLLSRVEEFVESGGTSYPLATCEYPDTLYPAGYQFLRAFNADPFPRWAYQADGFTIEKQLRFVPGENTVVLSYTLLGGNKCVGLELKPLFALRGIHELTYQWNGRLGVESCGAGRGYVAHRIPATSRSPEVFFAHDGRFAADAHWYFNAIYRREVERGYPGLEDVWMPGVVRWTLAPGQTVHFACSVDPIDLPRAIEHVERKCVGLAPKVAAAQTPDKTLDALTCAAAQFVITDASPERRGTTRVMAGYPWSPPAGRDTLISFTGLLLTTGRLAEAKSLLKFFSTVQQGGLMPSEFPWDGSQPHYKSVDASLWFVHDVWQYLRYGGDAEFVNDELLPTVEAILKHYRAGTGLGIGVDADGLLVAHQPGTPATWMDAKTIDCVVTPRYGRAVEVNALWYNAQRVAATLFARAGREAAASDANAGAEKTADAFNARFWNATAGCCYDVVADDGVDAAVRPNQLLAISLPFPVLPPDRQADALDVVKRELLTPFGLRTLSPRDARYVGRYGGNVVSRDRAHHQGSVFPWLLGPYVTAMLRVRGRGETVRREAGEALSGCFKHLQDVGLGQVPELFDGDGPHRPNGMPASARSVAELLRCYVEDVLDLAPKVEAAPAATVYAPGGALTRRP